MTVSQVRRKKRRLRREVKYALYILALISFVVLVFTTFIPLVDRIRLSKLGYSKEAIKTIQEQKLAKEVLSREYSAAFDTNMKNQKVVGNNFELYFVNTEVTQELIHLKDLLEVRGYKEADLLKGFSKLKYREMTPLLLFNNVEDIEAYADDVVANRGKEDFTSESYTIFYDNSVGIENQEDLDVLVNKYYNMEDNFVPELVSVSVQYASSGVTLRQDAYDAFKKLVNAMKADGLAGVYITSGYRSFETQQSLFNRYVRQYGQEWADISSARAGSSEHQTGLAVDITATDHPSTAFETTAQYQWMLNNSYKYGFILRYPADKTSITGYKYESWHYRYLGTELAEKVYNSDLTYDEYYEIYLR